MFALIFLEYSDKLKDKWKNEKVIFSTNSRSQREKK